MEVWWMTYAYIYVIYAECEYAPNSHAHNHLRSTFDDCILLPDPTYQFQFSIISFSNLTSWIPLRSCTFVFTQRELMRPENVDWSRVCAPVTFEHTSNRVLNKQKNNMTVRSYDYVAVLDVSGCHSHHVSDFSFRMFSICNSIARWCATLFSAMR